MKQGQLQWFFPTPIMEYDLSEYLTPEIAKALQSMGRSNNNLVEGIRANKNPADLPECFELYNIFQKCVNEYSIIMGIRNSIIFESWMNILTVGGSVGVHRHYGSVISAAFYPYTENDSAPLTFVNPLEGFRMIDAGEADDSLDGTYASNVRHIEAITGKLVLFPGWIQHYVTTNKSKLRVTLSFNTKFEK